MIFTYFIKNMKNETKVESNNQSVKLYIITSPTAKTTLSKETPTTTTTPLLTTKTEILTPPLTTSLKTSTSIINSIDKSNKNLEEELIDVSLIYKHPLFPVLQVSV